MPRTGITVYDLLISCPGDVLKYAGIVKECVETFNHNYGCHNSVVVLTRDWATDSFPQSGDRPQELLNKQFVRDCDAAVVIFWTKFGTPTDKYGSGTEEEIEEMFSADKQVFLYFVDAPISPSEIDDEQYKKVIAFKKKYEERVLYSVVKDEADFRKQFSNNLTKYFQTKKTGEAVQDTTRICPLLQIQDYHSCSEGIATYQQLLLLNGKFMSDKAKTIYAQIDKLKQNYLPQRTPKKQEEASQELVNKCENEFIKSFELSKLSFDLLIDISIPEQWKETILKFCKRNNIDIPEQFWYVGDLKQNRMPSSTAFLYGSQFLEGSDAEQQRYKYIQKLYCNIVEYSEYLLYFSETETQKLTYLVIENIGTTYDEDIDVKLIVEKNCLLTYDEFPVPGINIIGEILEKNFLKAFYKLKGNDSVSEYNNYPDMSDDFNYGIVSPFTPTYASEKYEKQKKSYKSQLKHIMCYQRYVKNTCDILILHIPYLRQHVKMAFPSVLAFKNPPKEIEYEITSKHIPDIIKGRISLVSTER